jgi:hypothetical protein
MSKFKKPKNQLAYLNHLMPRGYHGYFTRKGIGCLIRCSFCPALPPVGLTGYQKWRWLCAHVALMHHGKERPAKPGAGHRVEQSQEPMRRSAMVH